MRILFSILIFLYSWQGFGQNSINSIYTEDVARDFIRIDFENNIGTIAPAIAQFNVNGVSPVAVILLDDTTLYLKFSNDFLEGANLKLDYSASAGLLGGLSNLTNKQVDNRITNGAVFHWTTSDLADTYSNYDNNFNVVRNVPEGSIIKLAPGDYGMVDIAFITNVTFCAEYSSDPVIFTYVNFREKAIHVGLVGHPAAGRNIRIRSTYAGWFGMGIYATGRIRLENLEVYNVSIGIQVKTVSNIPSAPYNLSRLNYQDLFTKNIYIHDISDEAFYIGSDVAAPLIPIHWTGYGLTCTNIGRDAYQYRNGDWVWLKNCKMNYIGQTESDVQAHGFLYGTTTKGGYIENITGDHIYGNGLFINGYGTLTIKDCNISSRLNTVYVKNYDDEDNYDMKGLDVNFICFNNSFDCTTNVEGYSLDVRRDPSKTKIKLAINFSTIFTKPQYIETNNGVLMHHDNVCNNNSQ